MKNIHGNLWAHCPTVVFTRNYSLVLKNVTISTSIVSRT